MEPGFFAGWLAYVVITFLMGFLWHLVLFKDLYTRLAIFSRFDDPIVPLGFAAMVIQGGILSYLYPLVAGSGSAVEEGLRFGLIIAVLVASIAVVAEAAKQRVASLGTWLGVETLYYLIQVCLSGLGIALAYAWFGR